MLIKAKASALLVAILVSLCHSTGLCKRHTVSVNTKPSLNTAAATDSSGGSADFVATNEWRTVQPGQKVPPGLHVRMNIQTGETEARLMDSSPDSEENAKKHLPVLVSGGGADEPDSAADEAKDRLQRAFHSAEVKAALKKIKAEATAEDSNGRKFRSYSELRADFAKLNADVKTDLEILKGLLDEWHAMPQQRLRILEEFEYHLRQIDNGQNFVQLGGLELLLGALNSTELAPGALRALAAGCQGNAPVQVAAVQAGAVPALIRILARPESQQQQQQQQQLRSLCVLALASVCRNFPHAQAVLVKSGGLTALSEAFASAGTAAAVRIVTLLSDLTLEAQEAEPGSERRKQYDRIGLARALGETGWCTRLARMAAALAGGGQSHDAVEKTAVAMETMLNDDATANCSSEFAASTGALGQLTEKYGDLARDEEEEAGDDSYFKQLRDRLRALREKLAGVATATGGNARTDL